MRDGVTTENTIQITIDEDSGIPIWLQLRNRLIYLITSGHYAVGDKLPTVREMAVGLGINYNTVSKVYQDIEREARPGNLRARRVPRKRRHAQQRSRFPGRRVHSAVS